MQGNKCTRKDKLSQNTTLKVKWEPISQKQEEEITILQILVHFFLVRTITTTPCLNEDTILKSQKPGKTNIPIINRRAVLLVISHCLLLTHPRFSLHVSSTWAPYGFILLFGAFPLRFNFFFEDLPSAICLLPNKQRERSELEGCSPPVSLKIAKRKRQRGERSCLRKTKPRSEEGMRLLCSEECTCELQLGWVGMGQGTSLPHPCAHPRANIVSFPTAWHHHPETPKSKMLLPSYPHHPKPFASRKSGLWRTQS